MKAFYEKSVGACLSVTINKFVYVAVNETTFNGIRLMYDTTQDALDLEEIRNVICKETLRYFNIGGHLSISNMVDIQASGTGLGASSAYTVGLIAALDALTMAGSTFYTMDKWQIAQLACDIEIEKCGHPIGKQDQYAAAIGGLNLFRFWPDEKVTTQTSSAAIGNLKSWIHNFILVYSGYGRSANDILVQQNKDITEDPAKFQLLEDNANCAEHGLVCLEHNAIEDFGKLMHGSWLNKKAITKGISNEYIDGVYNKAIAAGAWGGKVLGAGGGGFMLFCVPGEYMPAVKKALTQDTRCTLHDFQFVDKGVEVIKI